MSSTTFTDRELHLQALAWQCFQEQPKVDFQKLAQLAGMTNPVSASNAWAKIKKKLAAQAGDVAGEGSKSPAKKSQTPGKRRKKADSPMDEEGEGDESPTKKVKAMPAKGKGKATPGKGNKTVLEDADGEGVKEDGGEVKVKGEVDEDEDVFN